MGRREGLSCCLAIVVIASGGYAYQQVAQDDKSPWHLQGEGAICCPCTEPCPCRSNHAPSYAHCEATLYLHIRKGHYGSCDLSGMNVVETSGACAMSYRESAALYFDPSASASQKEAYMKLVASFFPEGTVAFSHVSSRPIMATADVAGGKLKVQIPGILDMQIDRTWSKAHRSLPFIAASDYFSNTLQYVQNIRYRMSDTETGLVFDYSRRQANYRVVDLGDEQYRSKAMLIQFLDGRGWFNDRQLQLIADQKLALPDLKELGNEIRTLKAAQNEP